MTSFKHPFERVAVLSVLPGITLFERPFEQRARMEVVMSTVTLRTRPASAPARRGVAASRHRPARRAGTTRPASASRPVLTPVASRCVSDGHGPVAVRVTCRGRIVLVLLVAAVAVVAFFAGRASGTTASPDRPGAATATVVVHRGDTLWSISRAVAPARDPRRTVEQLRRLNHLRGADVTAGQRLLLPPR